MEAVASLPTLLTVVTTAAIDAVNPCAIGVLILMISAILSAGGSVRRLVFLGLTYTFAVFITYLLAGLGFLYFFTSVPLYITEYLSLSVASIIAVAAILEIKDYFWYAKGFSLAIPPRFAKKIHTLSENTTVWGVFVLGVFVSAVELPCTGAPYLAIISVISQSFDIQGFILLVIYNIVFVSPLLIILALVASGVQVQKIKNWKQMNKGYMRLVIGVLLVLLAWLLIFIANGFINLG